MREPGRGRGIEADTPQDQRHRLHRVAPAPRQPVHDQRLAQHLADRHVRVERGERILEDHLHALAVAAQRARTQRRQVLAAEAHRSQIRRPQHQQHAPDRRLAAARPADDRQRLPLFNPQVHVGERVHRVTVTPEDDRHRGELGERHGLWCPHSGFQHQTLPPSPAAEGGGNIAAQSGCRRPQRGA